MSPTYKNNAWVLLDPGNIARADLQATDSNGTPHSLFPPPGYTPPAANTWSIQLHYVK